MTSTIVRLRKKDSAIVEQLLSMTEPWSVIAYDAFMSYGLSHPKHAWYAEVHKQRVVGLIYMYEQSIHFVYPQPPIEQSSLYPFVLSTPFRTFSTYGHEAIITPIIKQLLTLKTDATITKQSLSTLMVETAQTKINIDTRIHVPKGINLRHGALADYEAIIQLFKGSEVQQQIDAHLINELITRNRIVVACYEKKIIGTIMCLKESKRYALLGGLFVYPSKRSLGIATLLGQKMVRHYQQNNRRVCFYYDDPALKKFYARAAFKPAGHWIHVDVTV